MHQCASIHNAMTTLTGLHHQTSEHHAEMGDFRMKRDMTDQQKIFTWFESRNPFNHPNSSLCSLSSGLSADVGDGVNCDETEEIGCGIQQQMTGKAFTDISKKKKETVKSLAHLQKGVCVEGETVQVNCTNLIIIISLFIQQQNSTNTVTNVDTNEVETGMTTLIALTVTSVY